MTKIASINDFKTITSNITSFSHAYLLNVNSLTDSFVYAKELAKSIILQGINNKTFEFEDISYKIDNDEFDDLYVVNPDTIGINNEEIMKLMTYMQTKSIRENGKRVYIIYGFERLSNVLSNKILKFLEEPEENIYAILLTENYEKILPTIVSRCQIMNLTFSKEEVSEDKIEFLKEFLEKLIIKKKKMIAYEYDYFSDLLTDRLIFYEYFDILERIISETLNYKYHKKDSVWICRELLEFSNKSIINILDITNHLKCLIKNNINLNLLLDRYIIEVTEELSLCKE